MVTHAGQASAVTRIAGLAIRYGRVAARTCERVTRADGALVVAAVVAVALDGARIALGAFDFGADDAALIHGQRITVVVLA
jgi:hypothetical protein